MAEPQHKKIALLGNPNAGKSSLFNQLTGLRQRVGNFPGVTVERKTGTCKLDAQHQADIIDLPGTYSFYPSSMDERIAVYALLDTAQPDYPDAVIYIADVMHLERHLLLLTQVADLQLPVVVALNMNDIAEEQQLHCDTAQLSKLLSMPVVKINGRNGDGVAELKKVLLQITTSISPKLPAPFYTLTENEKQVAQRVGNILPIKNDYHAILLAHHATKLPFLTVVQKNEILSVAQSSAFNSIDSQLEEIMQRYRFFTTVTQQVLSRQLRQPVTLTDKIDRFVTHKVAGPLIFFAILLLVFQAIFAWSAVPMDWIDMQFAQLAATLQELLPDAWWARLLTEGLIPGISGVLIFVPQITILFFLITLLEEVGYMARAVFMFDNIMQKFGLNGRSIVSIVSGGACAIPAIMSTRTITNWKERMITIMVTPWISCSARIPVFAVLIGMVVPAYKVGVFNLQGILFMSLYVIGAVAALLAALVFKKVMKTEDPSFLMLELPAYRKPHWKNVFFTLYEKVSAFVLGAGKIILIVSVILWVLASYGPPGKMKEAVNVATIESSVMQYDKEMAENHIAAKKLEYSYAGYAGRVIEPVIQPLGFDWKIGIALITSFAAREVFVGTISTLYSIGKDAENNTIKAKLKNERRPDGTPVFTTAVAVSLVLFYLFAMQCMSTLATVYRETKSWKWPAIQLAFMSGTAYIASLLAYQLLR